ncbi:MAG TPA: DNA mismatch repair endonuclease MutL, partial [Blastocatellia bacterium]
DIAFSRGAEFEIRDLFFNVPARRKFLKTEATESYHIANLVTHYALANPQLSFTLMNNNRESLRVTPAADLRERAYQVFGGEFIGDLIEVTGVSGEMRARGFVSSPSATRTNRDGQYFFINGRYVRDKIIGKGLSEAYRAMIPSGVYPSAMLFVELPPHEVDVNVHPAKTEVRFVRGTIVHDLIRDAVRAAIGSARAGATSFVEKKFEPGVSSRIDDPFRERQPEPSREETLAGFRLQAPPPVQPQPQQQRIDLSFGGFGAFGAQPELAPDIPPDIPEPPAVETQVHASTGVSIAASTGVGPAQYGNRIGCLGARAADSASSQFKPAQNLTLVADEINPIGQLHNSFIIAADRGGLLLIDQHVAHERILFEQHWRALRGKRVEVQQMLIPETIDLTPAQASAFDQLAPELEENGFELGRLSGRTVAIKAVPAMLAPGAAQSLLAELLDAIEEDRKGLSLDELKAEIAAGLACRAAIKINMELAPEKMRWLIDELLKMENPATCPHGRPIILRITSREIEKGFQRS